MALNIQNGYDKTNMIYKDMNALFFKDRLSLKIIILHTHLYNIATKYLWPCG